MLLPREKYFDRITFEEDRQRLKKFYFDNGFFDVLVDTSTSIQDDGSAIDLKFKITENDRYIIREFHYMEIGKITDEAKKEVYTGYLIKPGEPYDKKLISQEKDRVISALQNSGYYHAFIADSGGIVVAKYSDELQKNPEYRRKVIVKLTFKGAEHQYRFGKTSIKINNNKYFLGKEIIEREFEYNEGDLYNRSKVLESENNFSRLSIIQTGRLEPDTVYEEQRSVHMAVNITLGKKYELTPGISAIYFTNKLFGGVSLEYRDKNFFGAGRIFSAKVEGRINDFGNNNAELSLAFTQPYLFNNNTSLTINPTVGLLNDNGNTEYIYSKNLARISYYIAPYTFYQNAYLDVSVDYNRKKFTDTVTDGEGFHNKGEIFGFMNSVFGVTVVHNSTNDIFNPIRGGYHSVTLENAGILPRLFSLISPNIDFFQYVKFYIPNKFFRDVSGKGTDIVALNLEIGEIIEYGKGDNIKPVDKLYKFFSGGGNSLRGWGGRKNGILDNKDDGGKFLFEGNIEYRWSTFSDADNFMRNIWIVGFWDFGNVWESGGLFRLNEVAMAAGIGLRYNTFVGPIRIDIGFKLFDPTAVEGNRWLWDKTSEIFKDKYAIHFGLGNAF
jgi:outer membrane protein assembly factor BamA